MPELNEVPEVAKVLATKAAANLRLDLPQSSLELID